MKSVSAAGRLLASGGTDDKIVVHDMKSRIESRVLLNHEGTVNSVAFSECGTHLFSGGSDGTFCATRTGNWQTEKSWPKAHKGIQITRPSSSDFLYLRFLVRFSGSAITCIAIHPSNKLALTIGDDKTLRTWNLIKGRQAYVTNLNSKGTAHPISVVWSPKGEHFSLTGYKDVSVWTIANAGIERVLECGNKSVCMTWISEDSAFVGLENGKILLFDLSSENKYEFEAHTQRVKCLAYENSFLYSASSSGEVKIWKFDADEKSLDERKSLNIGCRITCLALVKAVEVKRENSDPSPVDVTEELNVNKKKRKNDSDSLDSEVSIVKSKKQKFPSYVSVTTVDDDADETVKISSDKKKKKPKKRNKNKQFS